MFCLPGPVIHGTDRRVWQQAPGGRAHLAKGPRGLNGFETRRGTTETSLG